MRTRMSGGVGGERRATAAPYPDSRYRVQRCRPSLPIRRPRDPDGGRDGMIRG